MTPIERLQQIYQQIRQAKAKMDEAPLDELTDAMPLASELKHLSENLPNVFGFLNRAVMAREALDGASSSQVRFAAINLLIGYVEFAAERKGMGLVQ